MRAGTDALTTRRLGNSVSFDTGLIAAPASKPSCRAKRTGTIELMFTLPTISVYGSALASSRSATMPRSPSFCSSTKGAPRIFCISAATVRAQNSVEPPGGRGTRTRTGRLGYPPARGALIGAPRMPVGVGPAACARRHAS